MNYPTFQTADRCIILASFPRKSTRQGTVSGIISSYNYELSTSLNVLLSNDLPASLSSKINASYFRLRKMRIFGATVRQIKQDLSPRVYCRIVSKDSLKIVMLSIEYCRIQKYASSHVTIVSRSRVSRLRSWPSHGYRKTTVARIMRNFSSNTTRDYRSQWHVMMRRLMSTSASQRLLIVAHLSRVP